MALISELISALSESTAAFLIIPSILIVLYSVASCGYNLFFSPLSHVPGPLLARCTNIYLYILCLNGTEGHVLRAWHHKYKANVIRVAPNSVSISDPDAIRPLYIASGGLLKDGRYENFNLGPIQTIFSALNTDYRDHRAKAVAPLFATGRLRAASADGGFIAGCIEDFIKQVKAFKDAGLRMDLLDLCARLSIDILTGTLLGTPYGGLQELENVEGMKAKQEAKLSVNAFIFAVIGLSRFSLLPNWVFTRVYLVWSRLFAAGEVAASFAKLDQYTQGLMKGLAGSKKSTENGLPADADVYHGRLMSAGLSAGETEAQSKAIVFAGTDSTSVMLATILFHLARNPEMRTHMIAEIRGSDRSVDPRTLPYLHAAVKEGLRLGMANPTRLTRVVPPGGLWVGSVELPAGTVAGCAAYTLHHDPAVFPEPFAFRPERWMPDGKDSGLRRPDMEKSIIAFGAGLRGCIGKNLALEELYYAVREVIASEVLEGANTVQDRIELIEWFNGEIKGHRLDLEWS